MANNKDANPVALAADVEFMKAKEMMDQISANEPVGMIQEEMFKQYFLPCFAMQEEFKEKLSIWIGIAGNPFKPVRVVNEFQQPLFDVPPVMSMDALRVSGAEVQTEMSITALISYVDKYNGVSPARANEILDRGLTHIALDIATNAQDADAIRTWNSIFDRYGIANVVTEKSVNKGDDDVAVSYDPL